jgi:hypothetical protein
LYVAANFERDRVVHYLELNGLTVADHIQDAGFILQVKMTKNSIRALPLECGRFRKVYMKLRQDDRLIVDVRASGHSGTCEPNVLDGLSKEIAKMVGSPTATRSE